MHSELAPTHTRTHTNVETRQVPLLYCGNDNDAVDVASHAVQSNLPQHTRSSIIIIMRLFVRLTTSFQYRQAAKKCRHLNTLAAVVALSHISAQGQYW